MSIGYICKPKYVRIEENDTTIKTYTPYHADSNRIYRRLGGEWSGESWVFSISHKEIVLSYLKQTFGENGTEQEVEYVSVLVCGNKVNSKSDHAFYFAGRCMASRKTFNSPVMLSKDSILVDGEYARQGGFEDEPLLNGCGVVLLCRYIPIEYFNSLKKSDDLDFILAEKDTNRYIEVVKEVGAKEAKPIKEVIDYKKKYEQTLKEYLDIREKYNKLKNKGYKVSRQLSFGGK